MAKSAAEMGATDKEVARRVRKWLDAYQRDIAEAIRVAQRDGDIDPDADPDELALLILALLRGLRRCAREECRRGASPRSLTRRSRCYRARKRPKPRYRANTLCARACELLIVEYTTLLLTERYRIR